jgi:DNA-binding cell septation regulator SpoVG
MCVVCEREGRKGNVGVGEKERKDQASQNPVSASLLKVSIEGREGVKRAVPSQRRRGGGSYKVVRHTVECIRERREREKRVWIVEEKTVGREEDEAEARERESRRQQLSNQNIAPT